MKQDLVPHVLALKSTASEIISGGTHGEHRMAGEGDIQPFSLESLLFGICSLSLLKGPISAT